LGQKRFTGNRPLYQKTVIVDPADPLPADVEEYSPIIFRLEIPSKPSSWLKINCKKDSLEAMLFLP